jgi:general nucleoside transport system permease protein
MNAIVATSSNQIPNPNSNPNLAPSSEASPSGIAMSTPETLAIAISATLIPDAATPDTQTSGTDTKPVDPSLWPARIRRAGQFVAAFVGALTLFGVLMLLKGVNPFTAYKDMIVSTLGDSSQIAGIAVRATPIILAALAVSIPARAGMINVGGEGQLIIGGVGAMGTSLALSGRLPGPIVLVLMGLAAAVAGGLWAGIAALLRLRVGIAESVSTLLMNYIALDAMYFLIFQPWKDRNGSGQPATRAVGAGERLPLWGSTRVHLGLLLAVIAVLIVYTLFRTTSWGFRLRVVGGNTEAGRRAGLNVSALMFSAMCTGGMLAGLGGFTQLAGAEFKLRSGFLAGYGYVAFLASWLGKHRPIGVALSCLLLSTIAISGDSLQLDAQLPAASVNVLMALVLLGVFGFSKRKAVAV